MALHTSSWPIEAGFELQMPIRRAYPGTTDFDSSLIVLEFF
jgi:hypothetical protein